MKMTTEQVMERLGQMADPRIEGSEMMRRLFGIQEMKMLNIKHDQLQSLADEIGTCHELAVSLWSSNIYEAKMLACMIADPAAISEDRFMEIADSVTSWVLIDFCCETVLAKSPKATKIASECLESQDEKSIYSGLRVASALAANMPVGDPDELGFFDLCLFSARKHASNSNSFIQKAVAAMIRAIGARSRSWHDEAVETSKEITLQGSREAKWVASQALGELLSSTSQQS